MADKDTPSSRMEIFNEIEQNRVNQINSELEESGSKDRLEHESTPEIKKAAGKDATDDEVVDGEEAEKAVADEAEAKPVVKDPAKETIYDFLGEEKLDTTKVKIKVDGVEQEVPIGELVRQHQKGAAADRRLEEASIANRQAQQVLAQANADADLIRNQAKNSQTVVDDSGKDKGLPSSKDAILAAGNSMYEGNQEQYAEQMEVSIRRIAAEEAAKATGATIDEDRIVDRAADKAATKNSWSAAISKFNTDHADIAQDPELARMMQRHLNEAAQTESTPQGAIEKAVSQVTGWLSKVSGKSGDEEGDGKSGLHVDVNALTQRKEDKARSDPVRSNTSIRSQSRAEPEEEYNASKVVAEMKAARGQS